ncbi:MAG: hypothetical protein R2830_17885 [Saprospiraceae bacterium]
MTSEQHTTPSAYNAWAQRILVWRENQDGFIVAYWQGAVTFCQNPYFSNDEKITSSFALEIKQGKRVFKNKIVILFCLRSFGNLHCISILYPKNNPGRPVSPYGGT